MNHLKHILVEISKLSEDKIEGETPSEITVVEKKKIYHKEGKNNYKKSFECWHCKKKGHRRVHCYA